MLIHPELRINIQFLMKMTQMELYLGIGSVEESHKILDGLKIPLLKQASLVE